MRKFFQLLSILKWYFLVMYESHINVGLFYVYYGTLKYIKNLILEYKLFLVNDYFAIFELCC